MTPMIDVVFQLLIFFVCTVEFQRAEDVLEAAIPAEGPGAAQRSPEELDLGKIEVTITRATVDVRFQGRLRRFPFADVDADTTPLQRQLETWQRIDARIPVRIGCQPDVPTGVPLRVYDLCLQVGFKDVALANPR
jgi:biopolymer transport protein ExbD